MLLEQGAITDDQLARATAERYGYAFVDLNEFNVDMGAANLLSGEAAKRYRAVPVAFQGAGSLLLATADPTNVLALDDIRMVTGHDCRVAVAVPSDLDTLIARLSSLDAAVEEAMTSGDLEDEEGDLEDELSNLNDGTDDGPVVKLVHGILGQAVERGASDIHFERGEGDMRVRFRIDGVLHHSTNVPRRMISSTISRLKIMSELDIAERRIPQDGRVSLTIEGRRIDMRVVTIPTPAGEGAVMRILDKESTVLTLDKLGIGGEARKRFESSFRKPYGAIIVTGPTGSGKSTTLYAALNVLNQVEKKIITIEDPVEYHLEGANQIQVNKKAKLTFAAGLRSVLRADPDIIMVGEIRDGETAKIAIESALTGHLMLSTLHTNDAPGAITRLTEMGIEPFLTASAIECVIAQRLCRKLCENCKEAYELDDAKIAELSIQSYGASVTVYRPKGCPRCANTGYKGRVGLYEAMVMTDDLRDMTINRASAEDLMRLARVQGMRTLQEDALMKLQEGTTSVEELLRVAG
ncbi:MAG: GspE/PulE family protein [Solirubrobacterales bacterium]